MNDSYRYFENRACQYYPCHKGIEELNCLFCYCPLYALGESCGGDVRYTNGIKDCSHCLRPHLRENFHEIQDRFEELADLAKGNERNSQL